MARLRLTLENKTGYRTTDLRAFCRAAIKAEGAEGRWGSLPWRVRIVHSQDHRMSGYAFLESQSFCLRIPKPNALKDRRLSPLPATEALPASVVTMIAQVAAHEVGHCLGLKHHEMSDCGNFPVEWAAALPIRVKKPKAHTTDDERRHAMKLKRAQRAAGRVQELERELKRKANLLKKWRRKAAYYERTLGKAAMRQER